MNRAFGDNVKGREDEQCEQREQMWTYCLVCWCWCIPSVRLVPFYYVVKVNTGSQSPIRPHSPHLHRTKVPCTVLLVMPSRLGSLATGRWLRFTNERIQFRIVLYALFKSLRGNHYPFYEKSRQAFCHYFKQFALFHVVLVFTMTWQIRHPFSVSVLSLKFKSEELCKMEQVHFFDWQQTNAACRRITNEYLTNISHFDTSRLYGL